MSENNTCAVCGSYVGSSGHREGRGPDQDVKRCYECANAGKVPDGYELKRGELREK